MQWKDVEIENYIQSSPSTLYKYSDGKDKSKLAEQKEFNRFHDITIECLKILYERIGCGLNIGYPFLCINCQTWLNLSGTECRISEKKKTSQWNVIVCLGVTKWSDDLFTEIVPFKMWNQWIIIWNKC